MEGIRSDLGRTNFSGTISGPPGAGQPPPSKKVCRWATDENKNLQMEGVAAASKPQQPIITRYHIDRRDQRSKSERYGSRLEAKRPMSLMGPRRRVVENEIYIGPFPHPVNPVMIAEVFLVFAFRFLIEFLKHFFRLVMVFKG